MCIFIATSLSRNPSFISSELYSYHSTLPWLPKPAGKAVIWRTPPPPCLAFWEGAEIHHLLVRCPLVLPTHYGLLGWMEPSVFSLAIKYGSDTSSLSWELTELYLKTCQEAQERTGEANHAAQSRLKYIGPMQWSLHTWLRELSLGHGTHRRTSGNSLA